MNRTATLMIVFVGWSAVGVFGFEGPSIPSIPFHLRGDAGIVVRVTVNHQGPFRFLLDTGSSRSAISAGLARRLRQLPSARTSMVTPSGQAMRLLTRLDRLSFGGVDAVSVAVMIAPDDDLGYGVDGLIGQDVLAALNYTIDYRHRRIVWHAPYVEHDGVRLPLDWHEGQAVVSLSSRDGREAGLRLVPDSGADAWVLFARPNRALPAFTLLAPAVLRTLAGQRLTRSVLIDDIDVGAVRLHQQRAVIVDSRDSPNALADGLLPLHLFSRVTFNGPARYLVVEQ